LPKDLLRLRVPEQGVSKQTIYAWKAKYSGMEVSEAKEVTHMRDENGG
jgi:putative transposase